MKVILMQMVPKVGKQGQVVTVADGYARNFLFPRGLAIVADKKQLVALEKRNARLEAKLAETKSAAEKLKEKLNDQVIRLEGKAGKESIKLFGAITAQDIQEAIKAQLKVEVERKQVGLLEPIKRLGVFMIPIDLHRDVDAVVRVEVAGPDGYLPEDVPTPAPKEEFVAPEPTEPAKAEAPIPALEESAEPVAVEA